MINAWVEPLRTYRHPRGTCLFAGVLKQGRYALGGGPWCSRCGVRYWIVDEEEEEKS